MENQHKGIESAMLSESLQELLSAYVDGELSPTEYDRVLSALRDSALARDYVADLRSMSKRLKDLPALHCPPQLTTRFLQERKQIQTRARYRQWGMFAALAVCLFLGISTWWYISQSNSGIPAVSGHDLIAKVAPINEKTTVVVPSKASETPRMEWSAYASLGRLAITIASGEWERLQTRLNQSMTWLAQAETLREEKYQADQKTLLTGPLKTNTNLFKTLEAPLPLLITPAEFQISQLQNRWAKKGLFVLDISSKDPVKTLGRLIEAGQASKVPVVIDDEVKQRLAKKLPTTFMIYLENATEDQVSTWLAAFENADYWQSKELRGDASCLSMLLYPLDAQGRSQVARSLGLASEQLPQADAAVGMGMGVALSYYAHRLPASIGDESRSIISKLQGPAKDRLSLVVMVRAGK